MLHNLKHNKVVHERVVFLTLATADVPRVPDAERTEVHVIIRKRAYQATVAYGFMEEPDVPRALALLARHGLAVRARRNDVLPRQVHASRAPSAPGCSPGGAELFRWMQRNSPSAVEYYNLPPDRVIELGTQLTL